MFPCSAHVSIARQGACWRPMWQLGQSTPVLYNHSLFAFANSTSRGPSPFLPVAAALPGLPALLPPPAAPDCCCCLASCAAVWKVGAAGAPPAGASFPLFFVRQPPPDTAACCILRALADPAGCCRPGCWGCRLGMSTEAGWKPAAGAPPPLLPDFATPPLRLLPARAPLPLPCCTCTVPQQTSQRSPQPLLVAAGASRPRCTCQASPKYSSSWACRHRVPSSQYACICGRPGGHARGVSERQRRRRPLLRLGPPCCALPGPLEAQGESSRSLVWPLRANL